ncbi:Uncharacterised protein [Mycoplasmopsis arginini]|nr:Uncharacterised protein [Mycoplasmopsis arginini]SGA29074.1 Uncharacterised protein [Mycoplasmopsis arginini]
MKRQEKMLRNQAIHLLQDKKYKDNLIKVKEFLNKNLNKFLYYSI